MKYRLILFVLILAKSLDILAYDTEIDGLRYDWVSYNSGSGPWGDVSLVGYSSSKLTEELTIPCFVEWNERKKGKEGRSCQVGRVEKGAFENCTIIKSVNFSCVQSVLNDAFKNCTSLQSVYFSNTILFIGPSSFSGCTSLSEIHIDKTTPPTNLYADAFDEETYKNAIVYVPEGCVDAYRSSELWNKFIKISDGTTNNFTLSVKVAGNGTATYDGTTVRNETRLFTVTEGTSATIQFTPDNGYRIKSVKVNNTTVSVSNNQYTISNINANTTVSVEFEAIPVTTYTLSITASGNGYASYGGTTIRGKTTTFTVNEGSSVTITFTPDDGYRVKGIQFTGSGGSYNNQQYTISSIGMNTSISVEFVAIPKQYTMSITASGNGYAALGATTVRNTTKDLTINEGSNATITFSPDAGNRIKSVKVNGTDVTSNISNNSYTISNITKDTSVEVEFEAITHTLSITALGNGSASYSGTTIRDKTSSFTVNEGTSATITFSPDNGYRIKSVKVNNSAVSVSNNQYTISSINANTSVSVEFEAIPVTTYTLSITASGNGSASYNSTTIRSKTSSFTVNEGASATITFTPDNGYRIKSVKVNNSTVTVSNNQYTISSVNANTTVSVEFEAIPPTTYTLSITASGNGSASYGGTTIRNKTSSFTVNEGASVTILFTPDNGYRVKTVTMHYGSGGYSNNQYVINSMRGNTSISVEFEAIPPTTYTLSITASGYGSASYGGNSIRNKTTSFTVNEGTSAKITFSPDNGYRIKTVKVNGSTVSVTNSQYTISSINANTTVSVEFEAIPPTTYTLSITASGNGSATYNNTTIRSKTTTFTVNEGTSATITFTPDNGYRIKSVKVNGSTVTVSNNKYTISSITANTTVSVEFEAIPITTYTLSITASGNGSASYNSTTIRSKTTTFTVNEGTSATITFTPDNGYRIKTVKVNGSTITVSNNKYTISSISRNTTVSVEFEAITYTLSITASGNGSASYNGTTIRSKTSSFTVNEGVSATISFTPDNGYRIKSVKVNNSTVTISNNKYTISSISRNTTVSVEFEAIPITTYTLSITASGNGSASYNSTTIRSKTTTFTVNEGTSATITFTPDNGYKIKSVKVNGSAVTVSNNKYTISSISRNTTVSVEFEAITYTLSITASGNGSASYDGTTIRSKTSSFTVNEGTSATITFTPDNGYRIKSVKVNGSTVTVSNNKYTISSISGNTTVNVEFEAIPITTYTLSITASGNGSASYNSTTIRSKTTTFTVNEGTTAIVTFIPDNGYRIKSVKLNGSDVTSYVSNKSYTISNIIKNSTLEVEFAEELTTFTSNGINYSVSSYDDKTIIVGGGNYGKVLEVPAEITYQDMKWKVIGIDNAALADNTELAAIIWNPRAAFTLNVSNPNLLLYVTSANYAPSSITNVIVNTTANKIVLSDAVSGNDFYCPKNFTAKSISYTHNYLMTTGIGESRGWESIALPFDVQKISHSSKGEIIPFANWKSGDSKKPFWLMTYGTGGWSDASSIKANTPYIISMPNHSDYKTEFRMNGKITFSAANVTVKKSDDIQIGSYGGKTFVPCFVNEDNNSYYTLNVNSDYLTYYGEYSEGSRFVQGLRAVHPFEAYMTSSSSARSIVISDDMTTGIEDISVLIDESKDLRIYNMKGQLMIVEKGQSLDDVKKRLPAGVYVVNGKKLIIK